ncbi:tyrosine-protein kinase ryk [Plakobranchus ocellatus]|uniref:Tyrosine-protein kinase ryk n=1 Tax=Plakobranchus ocellatus TaxID=259542 RepID=A0AAV3Z1Y2_9GAST|nr:tyrosine-protein kinase ryk [Plakobranchus ocellatus]
MNAKKTVTGQSLCIRCPGASSDKRRFYGNPSVSGVQLYMGDVKPLRRVIRNEVKEMRAEEVGEKENEGKGQETDEGGKKEEVTDERKGEEDGEEEKKMKIQNAK